MKSKEGYGFLLFKSKLGPIRVFEAGDTHRIKGTKIECRKVLDRDAMGQQVQESHAPQMAKASLVKKESGSNYNSPNTPQWIDQKSSRTSAMDTTVNTDHGYNSNHTPARRTLRNTGQVFNFPQEYQQGPDDSFLSYHGQQDYRNQYLSPMPAPDFSKQSANKVTAGEAQHVMQPTSVRNCENPMPGILDFLDEEDSQPWPQERESRLTYVPGQIDQEDNDPFEDQKNQAQNIEEHHLESVPQNQEQSRFQGV
jgi:hypothetical protein